MDVHDEQYENIRKERYYKSLIGTNYAKGTDFNYPFDVRVRRGPSRSVSGRPFCSDHGSTLPRQIEIQGIVGISKNLQNYLKNHFGDAWKQKTMAYFISSRINPIFGTVEFKK